MAAYLRLGLPARIAGYRCSWSFREGANAKIHGGFIDIINLAEFLPSIAQSIQNEPVDDFDEC